MNIVFYKGNGIIPEEGGISRVTANLGVLFRQRGNNVWYIGAKNHAINATYDKWQYFLPDSNSLLSEKNIHFLSRFVRGNKVDVIINQNCLLAPHVDLLYQCAKDTGVKIVYCFHNSILTQAYYYSYTRQFLLTIKRKTWVFNVLNYPFIRKIAIWACVKKYIKNYRGIVRKNDAVVLLCEGQIKELEKACRLKHVKNARIIYNSIKSTDKVCTNKNKIVLWVGNFDFYIKRPDNMLRIWGKIEKHYPDWKLYMLGDGPSLSYCKNMAESMGLCNVFFTGRVNPESYYREASILCTTSVHECFPMVLLEGMSNNLALIAFDSFTSAKLLIEEKKNGILIRPFDIEAYAEALKNLFQNRDELLRIQSNSELSAERFCEEKIYLMWQNLFNELKTKDSI